MNRKNESACFFKRKTFVSRPEIIELLTLFRTFKHDLATKKPALKYRRGSLTHLAQWPIFIFIFKILLMSMSFQTSNKFITEILWIFLAKCFAYEMLKYIV